MRTLHRAPNSPFRLLKLGVALSATLLLGTSCLYEPVDEESYDTESQSLASCGSLVVSHVPNMTSNSSPSGTVTRSGVYSASYEAWRAFNSSSAAWLSETWEAPAWLAYEWDDGPRTITRYSIKFTNGSSLTTRAPRDWKLQGWTGSAWQTVDTRTNQTNWAGSQTRTFNVASPGAYAKYRLRVTKDNDSRSDVVVVSITQLDLMGPPCDCESSQVPNMTSNSAPRGTVTRSGVYSSSYEAWRAFNSSSAAWLSETWEAPAWLAYEWDDGPRTITRYSIKFTNGSSLTTRAPRDWKLQGWTGSSWQTVDTRTNQTNWAGSQTRYYNVAAPGSYSKYRLRVTKDNDSRSDVVVVSITQLDLMGSSCDGGCEPNQCLPNQCGTISDGCGGTLYCGPCDTCGDGLCNPLSESCLSCPIDCGPCDDCPFEPAGDGFESERIICPIPVAQ